MEDEFASKEERYFNWYLEELKKAGYIKKYEYQPEPGMIIPAVKYRYTKQLKTKEKIIEKTLLNALDYQPDFVIRWEEKARGIFFAENAKQDFMSFPFFVDKGLRSIIDTKGNYNQNDAWRRFSIEQRVIFYLHKIYVQKVIPVPRKTKGRWTPENAMFMKTFVPLRYYFTDKSGDRRKISFPNKTLQEFIDSIA